MAQGDSFEANRELVRRRLERELEAGTDFVESLLDDLVPGPAGAVLNPAAKLVYRWIGEKAVKRRARRQLEIVADLARDLPEEDPEALVDRRLEDLLETEEVYVRGRPSHERFDEAEAILRELLQVRLEVIGALLVEGEGDTYGAVVRSVHERDELEAVVEEHFERTRELMDLVQSTPALLPVPPGIRGPLWSLVEETIDWYEARLQDQFDAIFAAAEAEASTRRP